MREDIVFEELIEQIDLILNSSKPLPYHMKAERKLAEVLRHLQEIPEYDNLKQFEPLFDVESFLIHFLASADYTDLLKIIDRSTMKFKHIDDYTHLMALVVNPNIPFFEKTVVVDMAFAQELIKLGASADVIDKNGYTPLMYAVIRQDNDFLDLLLKKKVYLNEVDKKGRTAIMYAAIKNNLYAAKKLIGHKADIYKSKDEKWTAYKYAKEMKHNEIAELLKSNKDQIVLLIDNCDACRAKEKIFHKLTKNYPSFPRSSVITTTPDNDKNSKEHNWNIKFPFVKIGDSKTLDGDVKI